MGLPEGHSVQKVVEQALEWPETVIEYRGAGRLLDFDEFRSIIEDLRTKALL